MGNSNSSNKKDNVDQTIKEDVTSTCTLTNTPQEQTKENRILLICYYFGKDDYRFAFPTCSGRFSYAAGVEDVDTIDNIATKLHACHPLIMPESSKFTYDLIISPSTHIAGYRLTSETIPRCIEPNERQNCISSFGMAVSTFDCIDPSEEEGSKDSKIVLIQTIIGSKLMCQIMTTDKWKVLISRLQDIVGSTNITVQYAGRSAGGGSHELSHLDMSMLKDEAVIYLSGNDSHNNNLLHPWQNKFMV
jgi:hypothetical protein